MATEPISSQALSLHDAVDQLTAAWDALAAALGRRLEGWPDHPDLVQSCLDSVQAATREADALVAQALTRGGSERQRLTVYPEKS